MKTLILGIDEAGRGPVIGPMVLAGCLITEEAQSELKKLGVKDSKELTQRRREHLSEKIKEIAETFEIVLSYPEEIDASLKEGINLNLLEAAKIAEIINKINKGYGKIRVIIDCPSVTIEKWKNHLKTKIKTLHNLEIICEHKADKNHIAVSAASILAKTIREREMDKLREIHGVQIGSGYTSDPSTIRFLEINADNSESSSIFRKTWDTWKKASDKLVQRKLF